MGYSRLLGAAIAADSVVVVVVYELPQTRKRFEAATKVPKGMMQPSSSVVTRIEDGSFCGLYFSIFHFFGTTVLGHCLRLSPGGMLQSQGLQMIPVGKDLKSCGKKKTSDSQFSTKKIGRSTLT
mmetsp:Transcript_21983/g.61156  ORF Transcript_21983/g.61156 Transcript_21983/m.61156 type:complete len:124 (+) Transcript_21983:1264-1635(+)